LAVARIVSIADRVEAGADALLGCDDFEVAGRVAQARAIQRRIDSVRGGTAQEQRVAVGRRPRSGLGANQTVRTWPVVDHDGLTQPAL
jgi:hypothetical protein